MTDFEAALRALHSKRVNFVIIGAYAAVAHGSAIPTGDLDICYERSSENLERLAAALKPYHPRLRDAPPGLPFLLDADTLNQGLNFTLGTDIGFIDIFGEISGVGQFAQASSGAETITLFGVPCRIASLDVIIRSKRAAARPKDLRAITELEALKEVKRAQSRAKTKGR